MRAVCSITSEAAQTPTLHVMHVPSFLEAKRDGAELSEAEIEEF